MFILCRFILYSMFFILTNSESIFGGTRQVKHLCPFGSLDAEISVLVHFFDQFVAFLQHFKVKKR